MEALRQIQIPDSLIKMFHKNKIVSPWCLTPYLQEGHCISMEIGLIIDVTLITLFLYQLVYMWMYIYRYTFADSRLTVMVLCVLKLGLNLYRGFTSLFFFKVFGIVNFMIRYIIVAMCFTYYFEKTLHLQPQLRCQWQKKVNWIVWVYTVIMFIVAIATIFLLINRQDEPELLCESGLHIIHQLMYIFILAVFGYYRIKLFNMIKKVGTDTVID